ncbi:MAG TPA: hypothetical protein VK325_09785, partial [Pseudoxanthomonas sp.]|nr:hypothetical protein [Pseudoxanthomonas sp.]
MRLDLVIQRAARHAGFAADIEHDAFAAAHRLDLGRLQVLGRIALRVVARPQPGRGGHVGGGFGL